MANAKFLFSEYSNGFCCMFNAEMQNSKASYGIESNLNEEAARSWPTWGGVDNTTEF